MIKVNKLNKFYNKGKSNEIHVINETSLELPSKGLVTFLGHSGSGKTTLLNVIGGLDKFNNGNISYDDESFGKYKMSKVDKFRSRNIGYVFQNYNLLLEETVYDNLRIALDLIGVTDLEEQKKRIEYSLKAVGMFKYRKKIASFLSGGQQQRVSIARALIKKSKVIIADEPTGNLDSKNTIEVMNILKKISEQSLVLLVTHENDVANFYSDIIYEIKDGSIIGKKDVNSDVTFDSSKDDSTIYLKDLKETNLDTELGNVNIHSDTDEPLKINLEIIVKNGNVYLKSDKPIKLLEQSNVKVVNDNYKEMKREDISDFDYDTSWYDDKKDDSKKLKKFVKRIKNSFISFKAVGKKQKFLYICLAFIGIIMAVSFSFLSFAVTIDNKTIPYSKNVNTVYRTIDNSSKSLHNVIKNAYYADEITDIYQIDSMNFTFVDQLVYNHSVTVDASVKVVPDYDYNLELLLGEKPKEKDNIVISKDFAEEIAKETQKQLKDIIGLSLLKNDFNYYYDDNELPSRFIITGISNNDNKMAYVNLQTYLKFIYQNKNYIFSNYYNIDGKQSFIKDSFGQLYELRSSVYEEYEIKFGQDVNPDSEEYQILVPQSFYYGVNQTLTIKMDGEEKTATIVGKYNNSYDDSKDAKIIINRPIKYWAEPKYNQPIINDSKDIKLIDGKYPTKANEVIVSIYYNADIKLGEEFWISSLNKKMKVVGIYNSSDLNNFILYDSSNYVLDNTWLSSGDVSFKIVNEEAFNERLAKDNLKIVTTEEYNINEAKAERKEAVKEFLIVFAVTTAAAAIFVYFIMRSKMMSDIYNIGVYRSLGSSRTRINNKYFADIFILTTFTAFIGYVIGTLGYIFISSLINDAFIALAGQTVFVMNYGIVFLGVLSLYLIMNIFGMLPIIMLERKTPSEIIAKYDI